MTVATRRRIARLGRRRLTGVVSFAVAMGLMIVAVVTAVHASVARVHQQHRADESDP